MGSWSQDEVEAVVHMCEENAWIVQGSGVMGKGFTGRGRGRRVIQIVSVARRY